MFKCVWVEFVGYGIGIPPPPEPYLFVLSYRHNFVHRVQLFWRSACALQFMCQAPAVHFLPPQNPYCSLRTVSFERITLAHIIQEFLILYGFVDYFNLFVHKRSPFVPVLSYPSPQPLTYLFKIIFKIIVPSATRSCTCFLSSPNTVCIETAM